MQVMPINNVSFKSYICDKYDLPTQDYYRKNAWDRVIEDARQNKEFDALARVLSDVFRNGDENFLALEKRTDSDTWMLALYDNQDNILKDRKIKDRTFSSINDNAIIIDKVLKSDRTTKYRITPLRGEWFNDVKYYSTLSAAVIDVLEGVKNIKNKAYNLLSSDMYTLPRKYLERFAKKAVK